MNAPYYSHININYNTYVYDTLSSLKDTSIYFSSTSAHIFRSSSIILAESLDQYTILRYTSLSYR